MSVPQFSAVPSKIMRTMIAAAKGNSQADLDLEMLPRFGQLTAYRGILQAVLAPVVGV